MQAATRSISTASRYPGERLKFRGLAGFLLLVLGTLLAARAQNTNGTIAGNVSDTSGAAVVGATVTATNTLTNTTRSTVTDGAGQYTIPSLPAGTYSIDVEMTGFQGQRTNSIVLDASQTARQDFKITVGKVNETVTIEAGAAAALLQTESASVGQVIDGKKIVDLPLNGRDFIQLAQLIPGANAGAANSITARRARGSIATSDATYGTTALQVNGARDTQNRFSIDGIESMDYDGFTYNFSPSIDAIAEFRVDTSTSGTDVGAAAGANVNEIIKSGTNNLHGTLWEFNRNNEFTQSYDALGHVSATPARLNLNQFGGNVGGPVYIPHLYNGRDKTFFFFNTETGYLLNGVLQASTTVPDTAERSGDIDELINGANAASGGLRPLVNPYTGKPFVLGQTITVAPQSLVMLNPAITPLPNITPPPGTTNNFNYPSTKTKNYQHDYIGRGDQTIGRKDTISGHYIFDVTYSNGPATWANNNDNNKATSKHFVIAETHVFSPSLVNEFRYGRNNFVEIELFGTSNSSAYNIANGMMQIPFSSSNPRYYGPPNITISGAGTIYTLFNLQRTIGPRNRSNGINQFVDNVSLQRGRHFIKFGEDVGKRSDYFNLARDPRGTFTFDGRFTAPYTTGVPGSGLLDFLLGYIGTDSINPTQTNDIISSWIQGYSVQDSWNVTPTLTLTLGLRWDHYAPWVEANNLYSDVYVQGGDNGFIPDHIVTPATSSYGRGLIQPVYKDFAPRVGFAYQPYGLNKVVVRGGYGIYYTPEIANVFYQMAEGAQEANAAIPGANLGDGVAGQTIPNLTWSNPFPGAVATTTPSYLTTPELSQHLKDQMNQEFNLTMQTELPGRVSGQIGYVGARGTHTFQYYSDVNPPPPVNPKTPGLGSTNSRRANPAFPYAILGDLSTGSSSYHSLQAKLERRVGNGLNVLASYTWSKSISAPGDIGGLVGGGLAGAQSNNPYDPSADRSRSIYDIPQRFVITALYDLPFFRNTTGFTKLMLDGFQVSTIVTAISGDILSPGYNGPSVNASTLTTRADVVPGQQVSVPNKTPLRVFNTGAFKNPAVATFGNAPRLDIRAPGYLDSDLSATKGFKFGEARNLQLRADFFNAFKHFNATASSIDTTLNDANYGRIGNGINQQYATRIIQLAGKLYF